jgi:HPt (histidine-containing phosphotransfer) domain-containing protein
MAIEAGVNEFLAKPIQADDLRKALLHCEHEFSSGIDYELFEPLPIVPILPIADPAPAEPINTRVFQEFVDLMPSDTVQHQLAMLFEAGSNEVTALADSLSANDRFETGAKAHRLKGVCMLMGLTTMANTLANIEAASLHMHADMPSNLMAQLWADVDETRLVLTSLNAVS